MTTRFPLYHQIARSIEQRIAQGDWSKDRAIPSEVKLAQLFGVSVGTVRRAIEKLIDEEILIAVQGSGTFVKSYNKGPYWNRFQRFMTLDGHIIHWKPRLICFETQPASPVVAQALDIAVNSPVLYIERVLCHKRDPLCCGLDQVYLDASVGTGLTPELFEVQNKSLYQTLEESTGVVITQVRDYLIQDRVDEDLSSKTGLAIGDPLFKLYRKGVTYNNQPIEYRIESASARSLRVVFSS